MKIYIDIKNYKNGKYLEIIKQFQIKKENLILLIQNLN